MTAKSNSNKQQFYQPINNKMARYSKSKFESDINSIIYIIFVIKGIVYRYINMVSEPDRKPYDNI